MADYYPLIARAIAAVKDAPAETRAQVYDRARAALMKHLKGANPPLTPDAIEREDAALDEAIARIEAEILSGDAPGQDADPPPPAAPAEETPAAPEPAAPRRPAAPTARPDQPGAGLADRQRWRLMVTGGLVAAIAVSVALFAVTRREDPARYSTSSQPAGEAPPAIETGPKIGARVGAETPEPPREPETPQKPPGTAQQSAQTPPPAIVQPPVAVAQRAIMYEQRPEAPNEPIVVNGRAIWRVEQGLSDQGQPDTTVKAELEFPERSMSVEMIIRRNNDAALPASHLVEIKFQFRAGGGPVKELASPPTMKQEENQRGVPLMGIQVPVMENYFLIGLSNAPADVERNLSQLQSASWIDIPFRFSDDRIGVIAVEKGVQGADAIQTAIARWRN